MSTPKKLKYFAGGEWLESKTDKYMDVFNPSTGEVQAITPAAPRTKSSMRSPVPARPSRRGLTHRSPSVSRSSSSSASCSSKTSTR